MSFAKSFPNIKTFFCVAAFKALQPGFFIRATPLIYKIRFPSLAVRSRKVGAAPILHEGSIMWKASSHFPNFSENSMPTFK